jgi:hypothetical protein
MEDDELEVFYSDLSERVARFFGGKTRDITTR